jgi:hypothetical protein
MKHLSEEDLILIYYNEPGVPEGLRAHVAECARCQGEAESLARTLNLCNEWSVPEPDPAFGRAVWAGLAPHIETRQRRWFVPPVWIAAAAAAALVIAAFFMGRESTQPRPAALAAGLSSQARERILEISLADHLDRAGNLLTEISNSGDLGPLDFAPERGRAQDLVEEGRLMRQSLARQGGGATLAFLDEVERFLLEVANAPDSVSAREVRQMRERIGSGSLLFKVRIIESNLRTQGQKL